MSMLTKNTTSVVEVLLRLIGWFARMCPNGSKLTSENQRKVPGQDVTSNDRAGDSWTNAWGPVYVREKGKPMRTGALLILLTLRLQNPFRGC